MNNADERVTHHKSLLQSFLYYDFTGVFNILYILLALWLLQDYSYNEGLNQIRPSLILLFVSISLGIVSAKKF